MVEDHKGIPIVTKTPLYTFDWYVKWISSIILMISTILTANNIFPINLFILKFTVILLLLVSQF